MNNMIEQLRARRRQEPFTPFAFVLKDGRRLTVMDRFQFGFNEFQVIVLDNRDRITRFAPADIATFEQLHPVG